MTNALTEEARLLNELEKELQKKERRKNEFVVKIIIAEKLLKGTFLFLLSVSFFPIFSEETVEFLHTVSRQTHVLSNAHFITVFLFHLDALSSNKFFLISLFFFIWGLTELIEGVGLIYRRRWAEYMVVLGTAIFIPIETYTLLSKFTVDRVILLSFNIFLVLYLVISRKLFVVSKNKR